MVYRFFIVLLTVGLALAPLSQARAQSNQPAAGITYFISSSYGSDSNDGLSESKPLQTVAKVNTLSLQPGDQVLFKCGDTWRAERLVITRSGASGSPITFSSYPAGCADKPLFSGTQPISGWSVYSGSIYWADLSAGDNANAFPFGINQLFRSGERLPLGRWPNLDAGGGGYSTIDAHNLGASGSQVRDNELPAGNWAGASMHLKGMRWYILNRDVLSSSANTLTLNFAPGCGPSGAESCIGYGYFINNNLMTLDQEGEWFYDKLSGKVYLYTTRGVGPDDRLEGSVVFSPSFSTGKFLAAITLGRQGGGALSFITVDNLAVRGWFSHGVSYPEVQVGYENTDLTLQNLAVKDVDGIGVNLKTWLYQPAQGPDSWHGGTNILVTHTLVDGANQLGIDVYSRHSLYQDNIIRNTALIKNLGAGGMGCFTTMNGGQCSEDGVGFHLRTADTTTMLYSGNNNVLRYNRIEDSGGDAIVVIGYSNTVEYNYISRACLSKADCGGIHTYGGPDMDNTTVYDLKIRYNIIDLVPGVTDGVTSANYYNLPLGMGIYIDNYSRNIEVTGNTITRASVAGILFQNSTGKINDNVLYDNSTGALTTGQIALVGEATSAMFSQNNTMFAISERARTYEVSNSKMLITSDYNRYYHVVQPTHVYVIDENSLESLAQWRSYSGKDTHSTEKVDSALANAELIYNDSAVTRSIPLSKTYRDLDGNPVTGSLTLKPFESSILIPSLLLNSWVYIPVVGR